MDQCPQVAAREGKKADDGIMIIYPDGLIVMTKSLGNSDGVWSVGTKFLENHFMARKIN
jgi:hypothetical protein